MVREVVFRLSIIRKTHALSKTPRFIEFGREMRSQRRPEDVVMLCYVV